METQIPKPSTSKMVILAIVYRATKMVGDQYDISPKGQIMVAEPLADKIVEMVSMQGGVYVAPTIVATDLEVFNFMNDILDIVEKSIPLVRNINMTLTTSRFAERGAYDGDPDDTVEV